MRSVRHEPSPQTAHPLLLPDSEGHGLALQNHTLAWLRALPGPIAVVTAIGQYRSGKSYLLNQLMEMPCDRGFGVGHRRETQTKGVWAFASNSANDSGTTHLYLDTEGAPLHAPAGVSIRYDGILACAK